MDVIDLGPDLRMLLGAPGQAYLLRTAAGVVLVDTGPVGQGPVIAAALRDWDRGPLTHVLLTHWHADHAGSAAEVGAWPGVVVWAHRADAPVVRGEVVGAPPVFTPVEEALHAQIADGLPGAPPARVDRDLGDDEVLDALGARVVATPGHTDGSMAVHFAELGVLCTGDVAAEHEGAVILGPFNTDRALAAESFRRLGGLGAETICFGHGRPLRGDDTALLDTAARAVTVPDPLGGAWPAARPLGRGGPLPEALARGRRPRTTHLDGHPTAGHDPPPPSGT